VHYYGVPQSMGPVDFNDERQLLQRRIYVSRSRTLLWLRIWQIEVVHAVLRGFRALRLAAERVAGGSRRRELSHPSTTAQPGVPLDLFAD
jgi:hypothetical protein